MLIYPFSEARAVLVGCADIAASAPEDLTDQFGCVFGPDSAPVVMIVPTWCGRPEEGEARIAPLHCSPAPWTCHPMAPRWPHSTRISLMGNVCSWRRVRGRRSTWRLWSTGFCGRSLHNEGPPLVERRAPPTKGGVLFYPIARVGTSGTH